MFKVTVTDVPIKIILVDIPRWEDAYIKSKRKSKAQLHLEEQRATQEVLRALHLVSYE